MRNQLAKTYRIPHSQIELSYTDPKDGQKILLKDDEMVLEVLPRETAVNLKNLGKQISWKTVFLVEYAGPLIIFPILFAFTR